MTTQFGKCFTCGGEMRLARESDELGIGSRRGVVEVNRYHCTKCGEIFMTPEQAEAAQRDLATMLREQEGLLGPQEIIRIRAKTGLSQEMFEKLISAGPKTVVRWERGTVFQNRTTDALLRVIDEVPAALEFLSVRNGVPLPNQSGAARDVAQPRPNLRELSFSLPSSVGDRRRGDRRGSVKKGRMIKLAEFKAQRKHFRVERETLLPPIPIEALR